MAAGLVLDDRYELTERLGEGGMSVVWRGYDTVLGRPVAVKVLAAGLVADASARDRFQTEARSVALLSHPHIASVHDYGEFQSDSGESVPYLVMELLSGSTLADRLNAGPLPVLTVVQICAQVASALAAAHREGIVHRDVKPRNVMLTPTGAKVLDFGLAAVAGQPEESASDGVVLGTPAYLAPERLTSDEVVPASDVYGLGLLLYFALTGGMPWLAETAPEMIAAHRYVEPSPLPPITGLPPGVAALCRQCLARDAVDRPTAAEAARVLAEAVGWRVAEDQTATPIPTRAALAAPIPGLRARMNGRLWRTTALTGAAVAVVGALVAGILTAEHAQYRPDILDPGLAGPRPEAATPTGPPALRPEDEPEPEPVLETSRPGPADRSGDDSGSGGSLPEAAGPAPEAGSGYDPGTSDSSEFEPPASDSGSGSGSESGSGSGSGSDPGSPPRDDSSDPVERTVETLAGTIVARCVGDTVSLVSWKLLPGFSVGTVEPGPGSEARITLNALLTTVSVVVRCQGGVPVASVAVG